MTTTITLTENELLVVLNAISAASVRDLAERTRLEGRYLHNAIGGAQQRVIEGLRAIESAAGV
ncbi:MAG: hypothetical protein KIS74_02930 [Burkholderiales bacterium]|nr:hypothetical protein [Burkholderiales bacterium]